jgi:hypothetical protein
MAEQRITIQGLLAKIENVTIPIPVGEILDVGPHVDGTVRVYWKDYENGQIGLTITIHDFEECTRAA